MLSSKFGREVANYFSGASAYPLRDHLLEDSLYKRFPIFCSCYPSGFAIEIQPTMDTNNNLQVVFGILTVSISVGTLITAILKLCKRFPKRRKSSDHVLPTYSSPAVEDNRRTNSSPPLATSGHSRQRVGLCSQGQPQWLACQFSSEQREVEYWVRESRKSSFGTFERAR